ncbi:MAG: DUF3795 domain-containing protein [Syntrophomonas sp.]
MEYHEILSKLSPCGLDCSRCAGFKGGPISRLSSGLLEQLGNYRIMAAIMQNFEPAFASYEQFEGILKTFAAASCEGCRGEESLCPVSCRVKSCHKDKKVDFCFQCSDFPCDGQAEIPIGERWLKINQRMKEIGVEMYYEEQVQKPRY